LGFLFLTRFHGRGPLLEAESVSLADDGVAADSAKLVGDLARGRSVGPHLFKALDALIRPRHSKFCSNLRPGSPTDRRRGMIDPPSNPHAAGWMRHEPGVPVLTGINRGGLQTLYIKEVRRF